MKNFSALRRLGCAQGIGRSPCTKNRPNGQLHRQTRHWETMTLDILMMAAWHFHY